MVRVFFVRQIDHAAAPIILYYKTIASEEPSTCNIERGAFIVITILLYYAKQMVITTRVNRIFIYCDIYIINCFYYDGDDEDDDNNNTVQLGTTRPILPYESYHTISMLSDQAIEMITDVQVRREPNNIIILLLVIRILE